MGPLSVSPMGFGTWAWGNQLLWGYQESMDSELQHIFNLAVDNGINLFDTADSYGTGRLNGQSEKLLGKFIRQSQGPLCSLIPITISFIATRNLSSSSSYSPVKNDIVIATKFAAYPWRLTPAQFVKACQYAFTSISTLILLIFYHCLPHILDDNKLYSGGLWSECRLKKLV